MHKAVLTAAFCCLFFSAAGYARADTHNGSTSERTVYLEIAGKTTAVQLADSGAAQAFARRLEVSPITYTARDYGGFEKVGTPGFSLPADDRHVTTAAGDIMLYQRSQLVLFYGSNSWSYTPIGTITGLSQRELESFLCAGKGNVTVTFTLEKP